jgi:hypothetical protein
MYCPRVLIIRAFTLGVYEDVTTHREPLKISKAPHSRPGLLATRICTVSAVLAGTVAVHVIAAQLVFSLRPLKVTCQLPFGGVVEPMTTVPGRAKERTRNSVQGAPIGSKLQTNASQHSEDGMLAWETRLMKARA